MDLSLNQFIVDLYRNSSRMPQAAFFSKARLALREWLPYQAIALLQVQQGSLPGRIILSHGLNTQDHTALERISLRLSQPKLAPTLPAIITSSSLLANQLHTLHQTLGKQLGGSYLIYPDTEAENSQLLILLRSEGPSCNPDRDRTHAQWLLPHFCEALRLAAKLNPGSVKNAATAPSPLELHLTNQGDVRYCGEYIQACIAYCSESAHQQINWGAEGTKAPFDLMKKIQQQQDSGILQLGKLTFDLHDTEDHFVIRVRPESIQHILTNRERQIASELSLGLSYKEVARNLQLSPSTVTNYANRIYRKLNVHSKSQLTHLYTLSAAEVALH